MDLPQGFRKVFFEIKDRPSDSNVKLETGENLGSIQAVNIVSRIGQLSTATIETICTQGEAELLQRNTELKISIVDRIGYAKGILDTKESLYNQFCDLGQEEFTLEEILELIKD